MSKQVKLYIKPVNISKKSRRIYIMSKKVVIAGACRTAIGTMGGSLSTTPAPVLGSIVIKEALNRAGVPADQVDHVYMGCVIQAGLGQNVARQASIKAGLPIETTAVTVNVVCGSGLNCVNMAAQMIEAGDADIVVAGGMENMSMAPYALPQARFGYRMNNGTLVDTMVNDALTDAFNHYHMMITAENVAEQWGLTREELDAFSANSQQKCEKAMAEGKFKDEIVPVVIHGKKGDTVFDILVKVTRKKGIHMEYRGSGSNTYIEGINNLYEFDGGSNSGWMYSVNGVYPNYGVGAYKVKSSDVIKFNYTCNLGADLGVRAN